MMAGLLEGALDEEGIPYLEKNPGLGNIYTWETKRRQIIVPRYCEERAREVPDGICQEEETGDDVGVGG